MKKIDFVKAYALKKILTFILFSSSLTFYSQNYTVEHFTAANSGFVGGSGFDIEIDSNNNLWFATNYNQTGSGLSKFDGSQWTYYTELNSGIASDYIINIASAGANLYAFHPDSVSKFDGTNWTVYNSSTHSAFQDFIQSGTVTANGEIWLLMTSMQQYEYYYILRYNGTAWSVMNISNTPQFSHLTYMSEIFTDTTNRVFITQSSNQKMLMYNGSWSVIDLPGYPGGGFTVKNNIAYVNAGSEIHSVDLATGASANLSGNCVTGNCDIRALAFDSTGKLWASESAECDEGSIFMLDQCLIFKNSTHSTFPVSGIYDLEIDSNNRVWGISNNGLVRITPTGSLAVNETPNHKQFQVFPNPAVTEINFNLTAAGNADIYEISGKLIKSFRVKAGMNTVTVGDLQSGTYILKTAEGSVKFIRK